jgi:cell division protein FtsL
LLVAKKRSPELFYYDRQRIRKRQAVRKQHTLHIAGRKIKMFSVMIAFMLTAVALVAHFTYVIDVNHQINRSMRELQSLQDEGKHLQLEIASLRSPERLESMAYEIGLQYPGHDQLVVLRAVTPGQ